MKVFLAGYVTFGKSIFSQKMFVLKCITFFKFPFLPLHLTYNISLYFTQRGIFLLSLHISLISYV